MRAVLRWAAIGAGLVLVVACGLGLAAYRKFSGNIRTDTTAERVLAQDAAQRPPALVPGARNILVMSARPTGGPARRGGRPGRGEAEAAVLLHLSADRRRAAVVGVPPTLRVRIPAACGADAGLRAAAAPGAAPGGGAGRGTGSGGAPGESPARYGPFADAFREGGAACSIRAFEELSGIRVDHHLVVDARGYQRIAAPVSAAGRRTSDRRGDLLRALAREARGGDGGLAHPARLYGFLDTATSAITADPGLSSLPALYELAGSLRALPPDGLVFLTVPGGPGSSGDAGDAGDAGGSWETAGAAGVGGATAGTGRADAARLFAAVRADRPPAQGSRR
ncbi:hypothetical protein V2S66_21355 [Streptomyces sp. V4-01]|uniref:Cell envelope-related transcriptional attenuator domain-containing protein n=1 Tax=Actinacidiphila polyblastidii TaxID=3110430 RepID=A0ABU7PFM6_9ACTN|nr:hypothetical protein [Streptomyces sp. V4-01]